MSIPEVFETLRPLSREQFHNLDTMDFYSSSEGDCGLLVVHYYNEKDEVIELMRIYGFEEKLGIKDLDGDYKNGEKADWTDEDEDAWTSNDPSSSEDYFFMEKGRWLCILNDFNYPPEYAICKRKGEVIPDEKTVYLIEWTPWGIIETQQDHRTIDDSKVFLNRDEAEAYLVRKYPTWRPDNPRAEGIFHYIGVKEMTE